MLPKDHDGVIITGKRKKGKTTLLTQLLYGEPRVVLYDAKGELKEPIAIETGEMPSLPSTGVFRCYVPTRNRPSEEVEWAAFIAAKLGRCIFVVDEMPDALEDCEPDEWLKWDTRMGRKRAVRYVYAFQRPQEVPRMMTSQAADWYLHQTNEPNELHYIKQSVSAAAANIVRTLKQGESVHVKDGTVVSIMRTDAPQKSLPSPR